MTDVARRFSEAFDLLESFHAASHDAPILALRKVTPDLEERMERLGRARAALQEPLVIVLLGGTGVGKSATINALAGSSIAPSSPIRPTTDRITVYMHEQAHLARLKDVDALKLAIVHHDREELREKAIIDAPDFDSVLTENRQLLEWILAEAELVLTVVDREKYLNRSLYELVRKFRKGRDFAFLFNKVDSAFYRVEVLRDFEQFLEKEGFPDADVFPISAVKALKDRANSGIDAVENYLTREIDKTRIERMKSMSLGEQLRQVGRLLRDAVPRDLDPRLKEWRKQADQGVRELEAECLALLGNLLDETGPFSAVMSTYLRSVLRGPVGFGVRAAERLSGWAGTRVAAGDTESLKLELRVAAEHVDPSLLATRLNHLLREIARGGARIGLDETRIERRIAEADATRLGMEVTRSVAGDLLSVFERTVEQCRSRQSGFWLLLLNLPVLVPAVYLIVEGFRNIFVFGTGLGFLFTALTILLVALVPGVYLGLLWIRRKRELALREAAGCIRQAVRRALEPAVLQPLDAAVTEVKGLVEQVDRLERVVQDLEQRSA